MISKKHYSLRDVRRGLAFFAIGRPIAGILRLIIIIMIVQMLDKADYGAYLGLEAGMHILLGVSLVGCDWIGFRYLPEYRANFSTVKVVQFAMKLVAVRITILIIAFLCIWPLADGAAGLIGLPDHAGSFRLFLIVFLFEGATSFFCAVIFEGLLLQGAVQSNIVLRNTLMAVGLGILWGQTGSHHFNVEQIILVEVAAAGCALIVAILQFAWYGLYSERGADNHTSALVVPLREMLRLGLNNYVSYLLALSSSLQPLLLLVTKALGPEVASGFGFAMTITEQVRKYLPATLLAGLIRPKLIADFAADKDFELLNRRAVFVYKISMLVFAIGIVLLTVTGPVVLDLISRGKYGGETGLVLVLLLSLIPVVHRRTLVIVANTLSLSGALKKGVAASFITLPLALIALYTGLGLYGTVAALLVGEICHNFIILRSIRLGGYAYRSDPLIVIKLATIWVVASAAAFLLGLYVTGLAGTMLATFLAAAVFIALVRLLRPLDPWELSLVNRVIGRMAR